ncbi:hypothetical protein MAPG_10567 [Magnaporthiopsis poae ATCC 64411]|uniref:Uncharacterized protein n=1 Tax=Magnaporthiopsis poae (strain ATCC 64411 / 73-15) TaxID=644358 RepID=A0A0C4ECX8_MAGP6|nr:hypothetical protein MAPG_10567 [Magnaporthiopsis poae ATCC 64411]
MPAKSFADPLREICWPRLSPTTNDDDAHGLYLPAPRASRLGTKLACCPAAARRTSPDGVPAAELLRRATSTQREQHLSVCHQVVVSPQVSLDPLRPKRLVGDGPAPAIDDTLRNPKRPSEYHTGGSRGGFRNLGEAAERRPCTSA